MKDFPYPKFKSTYRYCPICEDRMIKAGNVECKINDDGSWNDYHLCDRCKAYLVVKTTKDMLENFINKINKYKIICAPND